MIEVTVEEELSWVPDEARVGLVWEKRGASLQKSGFRVNLDHAEIGIKLKYGRIEK
jgi:hypothetical protein